MAAFLPHKFYLLFFTYACSAEENAEWDPSAPKPGSTAADLSLRAKKTKMEMAELSLNLRWRDGLHNPKVRIIPVHRFPPAPVLACSRIFKKQTCKATSWSFCSPARTSWDSLICLCPITLNPPPLKKILLFILCCYRQGCCVLSEMDRLEVQIPRSPHAKSCESTGSQSKPERSVILLKGTGESGARAQRLASSF